MTPKEKAAEMIEAFMNIKQQKLSDHSVIYYPTAKQCALVALHETVWEYLNQLPVDIQDYWQEVKQEILLH
jgi:hypothetical protein